MTSTRKLVGGRWIDVPDRPNDVLANIRRNNGGKTIAETTASFMPNPSAFDFLTDARLVPSRGQRKAASGALKGAGGSVTRTRKGATGVVVKGAPQSPMAGARDTRGLAWDVIRAGIHERATDNVLVDDRWMGDGDPKVDMASEESKRKVLGEFDKAVAAEKDRLAGQFADNLVKSVEDNVKKTLKPLTPTAAQTAEADTREKVGTGATPEERKRNLDAWNTARKAAHEEFNQQHKQSMAQNDADQEWINNMKKQMGMQSASKGGSARTLPVSHSEDRFLDDLIGEMEV